MASKQRDLLEVLKLELEFLKSGRYRKSSSWRPQFIFEDSPTCLHFGNPQQNKPCSECVLMQLVPAGLRQRPAPCRHIPLNEQNETLHRLYQYGTKEEMESAVGEWLMNMIEKLELERASNGGGLIPKKSA
jgi:hypothetical protein